MGLHFTGASASGVALGQFSHRSAPRLKTRLSLSTEWPRDARDQMPEFPPRGELIMFQFTNRLIIERLGLWLRHVPLPAL
jgi:hypothetical protein